MYNNLNWVKRDTQPSAIYYGYTSNPNASDDSQSWIIKKISTSGTVDSVLWGNGTPTKQISKWSDRISMFQSPSTHININSNVWQPSSLYSIDIEWNDIPGVDEYDVLIKDRTGKIYSSGGYVIQSDVTTSVSTSSYVYKYGVSGNTYDITVIGRNVVGYTSSTISVAVGPNVTSTTTTTTTTPVTTTTTSTTTTTTTQQSFTYSVDVDVQGYGGTLSFTNNGQSITFPLMISGGTEITISPNETGYTFDPSSITQVIDGNTTLHFIATPIQTNGSDLILDSTTRFVNTNSVWTNPTGLSYIYDLGVSPTTITSSKSFRVWSQVINGDTMIFGLDTSSIGVTDANLKYGFRVNNAGTGKQTISYILNGALTQVFVSSNNIAEGYYVCIFRDSSMNISIQYSQDSLVWVDFDTPAFMANDSSALNITTLLKNYGAVTNPKIKLY